MGLWNSTKHKWDHELPFALLLQHNKIFLVLQTTIMCCQCQILLVICQQEQQHLLFGRLIWEQNSWEQHSSLKHDNRQLQQLPEMPHSQITSFPATFSNIFYVCILRHKQTLGILVVKPSHLPWSLLTEPHQWSGKAQAVSCRLRDHLWTSLHLSHPVLFCPPSCGVDVGWWLQLCLGNK